MLKRANENPILSPNKENEWEAYAAFNPCVVKNHNIFHMVYRAMAPPSNFQDAHLAVSSIGYAVSEDGLHFKRIKQLIKPEHAWESYGCEDPRITKLNDKYYIFYTALSQYPFTPNGIKIGLAITKDFKSIPIKHAVTTFNSKAMALFPEKINGKMAALLTVDTDIPPSKVALALFDKEEDIWSKKYWNEWYSSLNYHIIPLLKDFNDHLEVGAPPLKTNFGWLLVYSYIRNYFSSNRVFAIEVVLLDLNDPRRVIGRINEPLLIPEKNYELKGKVPNIIFPSGAVNENKELFIYYGAADTVCAVAIGNVDKLLKQLTTKPKASFLPSKIEPNFLRYSLNPIIAPRPEFFWEAKATFNPAAICDDGKVHIIYRAMSQDNVSVFGYACSSNGFHIDERLADPIYVPLQAFEKRMNSGNSGCEDPRITKIEDRFYMFYTAFNGISPRVAYTSILVSDFLNKRWNWERARVITSPNMPDKDACLLSKKINDRYVIFHRVNNNIYLDYIQDFSSAAKVWLKNEIPLIKVNCNTKQKVIKVGISAPPLETDLGWLLFYHWVFLFEDNHHYKVGVALLDLENPSHVLKKDVIVLEPEMDYEKIGLVSNVVFPCGAVLLNKDVIIYYGGADKVVAAAKIKLSDILDKMK